MLTNDQSSLWSEVRKINSSKSTPALEIDGVSSDIGTANTFASTYETLFSSIENSKASMAELSSSIYNSIMSTCTTRQHDRKNGHVHSISIEDMRANIKSLRAYKVDGVDPISSDCDLC